jgi:tetratricopeptide (TPR) repeat protein
MLPVVAVAAAAGLAVAHPPKHVSEGHAFKLKRAPASVSYYFSRDGKRSLEDVRLIRRTRGRLVVPSMPAGSYRLLACGGSRCAAAAGSVAVSDGTATHVQAFSDSHFLPTSDDQLAGEHGYRPDICPAPAAVWKAPALKTALASARALLDKTGGMAQFRASDAYGTADKAEAAAFQAVAIGEPGAALAALLRAHDLRPSESRYLVAAAGLLTAIGAPREALALVERADALGPSRSAPFGINQQALALNAKGAALIALGQFTQAEPYLRAAIDIEPLLSEAKLNLSVAILCRTKDSTGIGFFRAGQLRQPLFGPNGLTGPPLDQQLDMTHGKTASLPELPLPGTYAQGLRMRTFYEDFGKVHQSKVDAINAGILSHRAAWYASKPSLLALTRTTEIMRLAYGEDQPASIEALKTHLADVHEQTHLGVTRISDQLLKDSSAWHDEAGKACAGVYGAEYQPCLNREYNARCGGPADSANSKVVDLIRAEERAVHDYIGAYYPYATAIAANIADPDAHELLSLQIEFNMLHDWVSPMAPLGYWFATARQVNCGQPTGAETVEYQRPDVPHSDPCPPSVRGVKLAWSLGGSTIEVNCEKVSIEVGAKVEGWFGAFGQIDYNPRTGRLMVFAGPKVSGKIPGTGIGGSFKDGLYLRFTGDGHLDDFGFRTSVSGSVGFGPMSIKGGDSMDFSFAPVFGTR